MSSQTQLQSSQACPDLRREPCHTRICPGVMAAIAHCTLRPWPCKAEPAFKETSIACFLGTPPGSLTAYIQAFVRGDHLSNTTCLTHVFFKRGE